ncbi:hypothetical protein DJ568_13340 [Mucilaginibacter hurinus]|uniref:TonB C-terminal domain-containing protein n=1 Tax=Mucilaginibacter hurinus TaxID=2201324 RepID=A0A367GML5_9SPHI|nr:energy transducer TonB [Mucilaginibacter hurinus]RCH54275.1 hypothetical protein DJ568_13340 [Mucilaginibacter hurinus]
MRNEITNVKLSFKCPVNYDAMANTTGGKFCDHCQKTVYDFTDAKAGVFRQILAENNGNVCGRFTPAQMNSRQVKPFWKKWLSAAMVLIGINLWGEQKAFAQHTGKPSKPSTTKKGAQPLSFADTITLSDAGTTNCADKGLWVGVCEIQPEFPGGIKAWQSFLKNHLSTIKGFKGRVIAEFMVAKDGSLNNIKILRGFNEPANNEVLRVLKLSPNWKPATVDGEPIEVRYTVPINFK